VIRRRPPVLERREVSVRGIGRPYFVAAPGGAPSAIVLGLHGRGTRPEWLAWLSDLDRLAGSDDVLAVFPQGSVVVDRQGFTWDEASDLPYLKAVADDARQSSGRSDHGVCVCGISVGARIASAFAAHHAADVDALGAVAGLRAPKVPPERPVPVMAFHGLRDRALPFDGGQGARWVERTIRRQERRAGRPTPRTEAARDWNESVPEAAEAWTAANGIQGRRVERDQSLTLRKVTFDEGGPAEVVLWISADAGHTWPGHPGGLVSDLLLGKTSRELDATRELWTFFRRHTS